MNEGLERRVTRLEDQFDVFNKHLTEMLVAIKTGSQKSDDFIESFRSYMESHEKIHEVLCVNDKKHDDEMVTLQRKLNYQNAKTSKYIFGAYVAVVVVGFFFSPYGLKIIEVLTGR